jgi:hypothetical protein
MLDFNALMAIEAACGAAFLAGMPEPEPAGKEAEKK